ncbi:MAG: signal transduction histidine kinase [Cypionkella sp.]|uniref:PAS domain S-box protein n=1 Tax=Cypionkella sp. TaxID=2811411 RepID=UPI00261258C8|nr:PAS domain S-box protein [Cypionkella sp.]MDB5658893.1 signal transduction histidine kinase [Cypionkella sp.]MDB5664147.1 signal transduction histidine kinase [Cypionkella sp.]
MNELSLTAHSENLLAALLVPAYITDSAGNITFYNEAAAEFWGYRPKLGTAKYCGAWRLFLPDGTPLRHEECPLAVTLRQGHPVLGSEAAAERPDGTRVSFISYPSLIKNAAGEIVGAINLVVDVSERNASDLQQNRLAAIVSSSEDAIISKTLDGYITSWNAAATRIMGYEEREMLGTHISRIIPPELMHEEDEIQRKLRQGERIEHFDTERLAKDGSRVNLSVTISPLRDRTGRVVGASKVARDITERKRSEDLQKLLFNELNHRVKNTLATIQSIADQSLRHSANPKEFVTSFKGRVQALARAHDLLVRGLMKAVSVDDLLQEQVVLGQSDARILQSGPEVRLEPHTAVQLGLVFHELATNARKYGALSRTRGTLTIRWRIESSQSPELVIDWKETGVQDLLVPTKEGFGSTLIRHALEGAGGKTNLELTSTGLACHIRLPLSVTERTSLMDPMIDDKTLDFSVSEVPQNSLSGRRVLIVEDDAIIGMDIEDILNSEGMVVVGPARTLEQAREMATDEAFEVALVDANLHGDRVDQIAEVLAGRGIPFAFATGYGRDALPKDHGDRAILSKPFSPENLIATIKELFDEV